MYSEQDILKLMREGCSADEIAESFTKSLNAAMDTYRKEEKENIKAEEETSIADSINSYLKKYYPQYNKTINGKEFAEIVKTYIDVENGVNDIVNAISNEKSADYFSEVVNKWLKNLN